MKNSWSMSSSLVSHFSSQETVFEVLEVNCELFDGRSKHKLFSRVIELGLYFYVVQGQRRVVHEARQKVHRANTLRIPLIRRSFHYNSLLQGLDVDHI
jgi:hypothetical protein